MKFKITVPATSANLGPGFDISGIALDIYNEFYFDFTKDGIQFTDDEYDFDTSLTLDTFFNVLDMYNQVKPSSVHLHTVSKIPVARGLGSSSTCIVAGIMAANQYASLNLEKEKIALIANEIEGHPDNVVSAIYGNLNLSLVDKNLYRREIKVHPDLAFCLIIPKHKVKTSEARKVLPKEYKMSDIQINLSRMAFVEEAFTTMDLDLLKLVTEDRLHEQYRSQLILNFDDIKNKFSKLDIITYWISGAGPSIVLLVDKNKLNNINEELKDDAFDLKILNVDTNGARLELQ